MTVDVRADVRAGTVLLPSRILDRHVGGNTTYTRHLADGLWRRGVLVGRIPSARHPATTAMLETWAGLRAQGASTVLHYTADTGPLLRTRTPSVVTIHGVASRWVPGVRSPAAERVWRERVGRAARHVDQVITVSSSSARDVAEVFDLAPDRISTIPHGIDVPGPGSGTEVSPEVAAMLPDRFVLYLGNIEPRKNVTNLVRAFGTPTLRRAGLRLVVAGRPRWDAEEAMAAIAGSDRVVHLGFVDERDKEALLRRCELFVFPSAYEGFGLPVLEALAHGTPVLASDRGSLAEVAGPAKVLASLDPDGIAEGVVDALADDAWRADVRQTGPAWAARFSWDTSVERHLDVYARALAS
jgi:glycosyltransferase involved in cell wall biosynthesis